MADLVKDIEAQIAGAKAAITKQSVGTIREIGDGVARVEGLGDVMLNEMLDFGHGVTGLALNARRNRSWRHHPGRLHAARGRRRGPRLPASCSRSPSARGCSAAWSTRSASRWTARVRSPATRSYPVEKIAPGIIRRRPVGQPVQTGIMAIDAMIPIGRGQRELIIGDRSTGKTTICIDTIISQARINKRRRGCGRQGLPPAVLDLRRHRPEAVDHRPLDRGARGSRRAAVHDHRRVAGGRLGREPVSRAVCRAPRWASGSWINGMDALIVYDDLSKHAVAYRQVSLVLKRPSGREAYPGDVFYLHSRLLERAARVGEKYGNGSLTALPIIETQAGDVSAYIPTNVISITDGQIFLETDLFYQGVRPAISVGHLGLARRLGRADQGDEAGGRAAQGRPRAVPRAGGVRAVRLRPRRDHAGARSIAAGASSSSSSSRSTTRSPSRSRWPSSGRSRTASSTTCRSSGSRSSRRS